MLLYQRKNRIIHRDCWKQMSGQSEKDGPKQKLVNVIIPGISAIPKDVVPLSWGQLVRARICGNPHTSEEVPQRTYEGQNMLVYY